jgi:UDP-N-acetylmuramoylalanine--D-glutamate ligase
VKRRSNLKNLESRIQIAESLSNAVELANKIAVPGDVVLLSPACASYDMFENFEQRGNEFIRLVRNLCS